GPPVRRFPGPGGQTPHDCNVLRVWSRYPPRSTPLDTSRTIPACNCNATHGCRHFRCFRQGALLVLDVDPPEAERDEPGEQPRQDRQPSEYLEIPWQLQRPAGAQRAADPAQPEGAHCLNEARRPLAAALHQGEVTDVDVSLAQGAGQ